MNEEHIKHRLKNAIILLGDGHSLRVGDLTFSSKNQFHLMVTGWTIHNNLGSITERSALAELEETKYLFSKMIEVSEDLSVFVKNRQIEFSLFYDDYGKAGIEICREYNGQVLWKIGPKK